VQTFGLRRAIKLYASQVRRQARRARNHEKARRIGMMAEQSEVILRAIRPQYVDPLSAEHLTKLAEALVSTGQTKPKEPNA
jgi:hypothetical protein